MHKTLRTLTLALLVVTTALAGCLGADDDAAPDEPGVERAEFTGSTGGVEGVVIDNAVQPVAGANVTVRETGDVARTTADGAFALSNLPPGQVTLIATAPGFHAMSKTVTVKAREVLNVEFTLTRVAVQQPYVDKLELAGFQECATVAGYNLTSAGLGDDYTGLATCGVPNSLLGQNATNDRFIHFFHVAPGVVDAVFEAEWQASAPASGVNLFIVDTPPFYNDREVEWARIHGESPLHWVVPSERIAAIDSNLTAKCEEDEDEDACGMNYRFNGGDVSIRVFPYWTCLNDVASACNNVQQSFTIYASIFYHQPAPQGYSVRGV